MMPLFLYIFILYITYIHSIAFIQNIHHPSSFAEVPLHLLIAGQLSGCWAENRTRACRTASRRTTNWATSHLKLSHAAPKIELRRTLKFDLRRTLNRATPHSTQKKSDYHNMGRMPPSTIISCTEHMHPSISLARLGKVSLKFNVFKA